MIVELPLSSLLIYLMLQNLAVSRSCIVDLPLPPWLFHLFVGSKWNIHV